MPPSDHLIILQSVQAAEAESSSAPLLCVFFFEGTLFRVGSNRNQRSVTHFGAYPCFETRHPHVKQFIRPFRTVFEHLDLAAFPAKGSAKAWWVSRQRQVSTLGVEVPQPGQTSGPDTQICLSQAPIAFLQSPQVDFGMKRTGYSDLQPIACPKGSQLKSQTQQYAGG